MSGLDFDGFMVVENVLDKNEVLNLIKEARKTCLDPKYSELSRKMEQIEGALSSRQPTEMKGIINNFEHEFNNSRLANVWVLRQRLNNLKIRVS